MVRASLKLTLILALVMATGSCLNIDLLAPTTRVTAAAGNAVLEDGDSLLLEISLIIDPGMDASGRRLRTPNPTLRIEDQALQPTQVSSGVLHYQNTITLPVAVRERQAIRFTFPDIPDANAAQFDLSVPIPSRTGSNRITLTPNADLTVQFRNPVGIPPGASSSWFFELGRTCSSGRFAEFRGSGSPPESITIPGSLLASVAPTAFEACLRFVWAGTITDGSYPINLLSSTLLIWKVDRL